MSSENTVEHSFDAVRPTFDVIAIVTSATHLETSYRVLRTLSSDLAAAVICIGTHDSEKPLAQRLMGQTPLPVEWAVEDTRLKPAHIVLCSAQQGPVVQAEGQLTVDLPGSSLPDRPVDRLLESLARLYKERVLALVLTGNETDGHQGIQGLKSAGSVVIHLSEENSESSRPSDFGIVAGPVDVLFPLQEIGSVISHIIAQRQVPHALTTMDRGKVSHYAEQILENIDMFYVLDENFCFTYLNRQAEEAWERRREDLIGRYYWTEFPAAVGSESYQMHLKVMEERQSVHYETISPILNRWVDVKIFPTDEGGLAVYFYDIDERKRREMNAALLVEIDTDLAYMSDVGEILNSISDRIVRHFGLSRLAYSRVLSANHAVNFYEKHEPDTPAGLIEFQFSEILTRDAIRDLMSGHLIAVENVETDPRTAAFTPIYHHYAALSQIRAPHLIKGHLRFLLSAHRRDVHQWRPDDLEVMREVTARIYLWLERTYTEKALRESEERYRTLFETMDEGFCIVQMIFDEQGRATDYVFLETNPAFEQQTGLVSAVGKTAYALMPGLETHWLETYDRIARTGTPERFISEANPLGRWYDTYAFPYGEGRVGILFNDITQRKQAEEALRKSEERYRTLFESLDEGFCILEIIFDDADNPIDYRFIETNPAFDEQTGLVGAVGKRMSELVSGLETYWAQTYGRVARTGIAERFVGEANPMGRWYDTYAFPYGEGQVGILFNDITQRMQGEEALRKSEERFRKALEIETVGVIFFNPEGPITAANDAFLRMGGYTREDFDTGQLRWDKLTPPEWIPASLNAIEEFKTLGQTTPYEKQYYRKDGSRWWALFAAKRLSENEGIEFVIDISKRKQVELALRETEERVRLILDSAKDYSIYAFDLEGNFLSWNTGAERMFGYPDDEVLGQHQRLIYTIEDRTNGIPEQEMERALALGYSENERWHVHKEGHLIYGSGMVRPLRDGDGAVMGFTKVMRDETDRKLAEDRMRMMQQLAADLSGRLTVEDMSRSILQASRKAVSGTRASLFLLNTEEQVLEHISDLSTPIQSHYLRLSLDVSLPLTDAIRTRQIVWGRSQQEYIQRYPRLSEDIVLNNIHGFIALPLILDENVLGAIAITFYEPKELSREEHEFLIAVAHLCAQALERARLYETEKDAREAAEKADQLKMQFLGMISHELRTPLASIKGYTTTLLATDVTFTAEEHREFLGVVDEETDKLTDLVVQLLDLTRLQAGNLRIELQPRTIKEILDIAETQLWTLAMDHELIIAMPDGLPPIMADSQRLAQVLVNLVGNAVKFSPAGSPITVRAFHDDDDTIQVDVRDEGSGIPPQYRTQVFEPFRQVERSASSHNPGAGLGLAICKGIIEAHGGQIWVQERDQGTTISFTLRVATAETP